MPVNQVADVNHGSVGQPFIAQQVAGRSCIRPTGMLACLIKFHPVMQEGSNRIHTAVMHGGVQRGTG